MGVFTFVCRSSGGDWCAKQLSGDLEAAAASTYELQRRLVQLALSADSSGGVQTSFSLITPSSAVFQPSAAEAPPPEEKKPEKEESEDEDMGFSLFD
ncbi:60S acidic ribosomal protein family [Actinidia rufa]|uniref:60S acidic ribosomal protein family n=1 Tax=Actinidia rufa TaxID=165716 RepID=A0A7J0E3L4_9ERIC|nr:60S acidic ribosomal protein family [Actinidia rufa]